MYSVGGMYNGGIVSIILYYTLYVLTLKYCEKICVYVCTYVYVCACVCVCVHVCVCVCVQLKELTRKSPGHAACLSISSGLSLFVPDRA